MDQIKLYLEKFKDWRPTDAALKDALQEIIKGRWQEDVSNDDIRLAGFTVYLRIKPILRSEIMLHREAIMAELVEKLGQKAPKKLI
ncbi:MAG: hypothetical protein U9M92_01455 [Patescibacteria group bacterium]|nr:hypothetical protein [Patescibacteria group bacterium]